MSTGKSTVKFGAVEVSGPAGPTDVTLQPLTATEQSANYTRWAYELTTTKNRMWTLNLTSLTKAEKDSLEDHFTDTAKGANNSFTYTHTDESTYTAYYVDPGLNFVRNNDDEWDVTVRIETTGQLS